MQDLALGPCLDPAGMQDLTLDLKLPECKTWHWAPAWTSKT